MQKAETKTRYNYYKNLSEWKLNNCYMSCSFVIVSESLDIVQKRKSICATFNKSSNQ